MSAYLSSKYDLLSLESQMLSEGVSNVKRILSNSDNETKAQRLTVLFLLQTLSRQEIIKVSK